MAKIEESVSKYDHTPHISQRRRALFPSSDNDDSDDLGHISPLYSDSNSEDTAGNLELTVCNEYSFGHNKDDYIILESLNLADVCNTHDADGDKFTPNKYQLSNCILESMSPLYVSPLPVPLASPCTFLEHASSVIPDTPLKGSPTEKLKTPHDASSTNDKIPKLMRKSLLDGSVGDVEYGKRKLSSPVTTRSCKNQKLDNSVTKNSKVRTALFPDSDVSLPSKSFYPQVEATRIGRVTADYNVTTKKNKHKQPSLYLCNRRTNAKNRFGQINAGVRHKIRKPKIKGASKSQILQATLRIMDNSPLNEYLGEMRIIKNTSKIFGPQRAAQKKREPTPPPDPSKKFFKSSKSRAVFTINGSMKVVVDNGKMSLLGGKNPTKRHKLDLDPSDLSVPENEELLPVANVDRILSMLDDEKENGGVNVPETDSGSPRNRIVLTALHSVYASENSIQLHHSPAEAGLNGRKRDASCVKELLLSPTSQMCDMTSGLALNSPKRAKQNITMLLDNFPEARPNVFNAPPSAADMEQKKLFPIFCGSAKTAQLPDRVPKPAKDAQNAKKWKSVGDDQMLLDAGQKRFGVTHCAECNIVYFMGDPSEELMHLNYHNAGNILRFNGWKNEKIMTEFLNGRIIRVTSQDSKAWWKKVKDLLEVVNRDLGFFEMELNLEHSQVYLYIRNKTIAGCVIAEPKTTGFRMLSSASGVDECSEKVHRIDCGVSRIWVSQGHRKQGIATALMDCVRRNFVFGKILSGAEVALSSPTEMGKQFAAKYFNTRNFLIYTS